MTGHVPRVAEPFACRDVAEPVPHGDFEVAHDVARVDAESDSASSSDVMRIAPDRIGEGGPRARRAGVLGWLLSIGCKRQ